MFRPHPEDLTRLLSASHGAGCRVESWRGTELLAAVPLLDGTLTEQADQQNPQAVDIVVPARDELGQELVPVDPLDPLNSYGQRLNLVYELLRADGTSLDVPLGWFVIDEWESDDEVVELSALGALDPLSRAKFTSPTSPPAGATFVTELRRLIGARVPLDVSAAPVDRAVPRSMAWQDDRLSAVYELADTWPALVDVDPDGTAVVTVDDIDTRPADVVLELDRGTVITRRRSGSRANVDNVVVARGENTADPNQPPVSAIAADEEPLSPTFVRGPYGEQVRTYSSPLLTTKAQCLAAARTMRDRALRPANSVPVTTVPDPRIGHNTRVDLIVDEATTLRTVVLSNRLPLTADGGAQELTLGVLP